MSIFGQLDAANITTNVYFIEKGDYPGQVVVAEYRKDRNDNRQLFLQYQIQDEDSQYNEMKVQQYFSLVPEDMTNEKFALLPADEKKKIQRVNAAIKRTLCGSDSNSSQKGLGVTEDELNDPAWTPGSLVGTPIVFGVDNWGKDQVQVKWVNLREE
jgi:hypothetical protein